MVALQNIIILASVILGSLAIPFVSNPTFDALDNYDESLSPVLNDDVSVAEAKSYPGAIERNFGPDSFYYQAETAFGMFSIEISNKEHIAITQKLTNTEASVERTIVNDGVLNEKWVLSTSEYTLTSAKNYTTVTEMFSNPNGVCIKTEHIGTKKENCSGQMYDMEDKWKAARTALKVYMEKMKNASDEIELTDIQDREWDF
ncbi:MAG: hypothetical protein HZB66_01410 [Candidatus Aenigmarchaeota archaeon]|nr:hypothetical protein [Candidatus Aenigmarchaeota archaeon]